MRIQENFIITDKQTKSGTTADGRDWKMTEYVLKEVNQNESAPETLIPATASSSVEELEVGGEYTCTLFVNSRKFTGKDDIERLFVSFRISDAKLVSKAPEASDKAEIDPAELGDEVPFNEDR